MLCDFDDDRLQSIVEVDEEIPNISSSSHSAL